MIQHVTRQIAPEALDACIAFYGLLGFVPVETPPSIADRAVWMQLGPTQLHLMPVPGTEPAAGHVAVVASPYDTVVGSLEAAGHTVEPRRPHWGAERAYVRDPFGNLVELMAAPPPGRAAS